MSGSHIVKSESGTTALSLSSSENRTNKSGLSSVAVVGDVHSTNSNTLTSSQLWENSQQDIDPEEEEMRMLREQSMKVAPRCVNITSFTDFFLILLRGQERLVCLLHISN